MDKFDDIKETINFFLQEYEKLDKNDDDDSEKLFYYAMAINALRNFLPDR